MRLAAVMALAVTMLACTPGGSSQAALDSRLVDADTLAGDWHPDPGAATRLAGGFCDLEDTIEETKPDGQAHRVLVSGEILLRHTVIGYSGDGAETALDALTEAVAGCEGDEKLSDLALAPTPIAAPEDVVAYRLTTDVAGLPLVLDVAAWHDREVLDLVRLTYPRGVVEDPLAVLHSAVNAIRR